MRTPSLLAFALAASLAQPAFQARADAPLWVNRTPTEFTVLLDADGDGDLDAVVADRATGLLRVARRTSSTTFSWETPTPGGIAPLDGLAAGAVVTNTRQSVALAGTLANRVALVDLNTAASARTPQTLFPRRIGPHLAVAQDTLPAAGDELFVTSDFNSSSPHSRQLFARTSGGALAETNTHSGSLIFAFAAAVAPSNNALPRVVGVPPGYLGIFGAGTNATTLVTYPALALTANSQFIYGFFVPGSIFSQILAYTPGSTASYVVPLVANATYGASLGTAVPRTLPAPPLSLSAGPATNEVTLVSTNGSATVYTFDGATFSLVNALALPDGPEGTFSGCLTDRSSGLTLMLIDTDGDGRSDQSCRYGLSGGRYVALDPPVALSSLANREGHANTLAFLGEPLVASNATRVAAYTVSDWSTTKSGVTPNTTIGAVADRGPALGLQTSATAATVSGVPADATHILVDQLAADIGVQPLFAAAGESVSAVRIDPAGGSFDTAVQVTLTAPASVDRIRTRLAAADPWSESVGTTVKLWLFKNTSLQYYGFNTGNGRSTPIATAVFTFTRTPEAQDSDGDGVPDFVELQRGLDPTDGQDADDDGLSDLDELLGGTQPNDADSDNDTFTDRQERAAGTNPNSTNSVPTETQLQEGDVTANERLAVYDLRVGPEPYDGFRQVNTNCAVGIPCCVTALDGSLLGTASTSYKGFFGIRNPSLAFEGLPAPFSGLLAGFTTPAHYSIATTNTDKTIGRELVKLVVAPTVPPVAVDYTWQGLTQAAEAAAWTNAARAAYASTTRPNREEPVTYYDTLAAALFEAFAARELQARGLLATNALSLFPARAEPAALPHPSADQLLALQAADPGGRPAYGLTNTLGWLRRSCQTNTHTQVSTLRTLTVNVYRYACTQMNAAPGQYPLPLDALRQVILRGTLPGGYTNHLSSATAATAKLGADRLLGLIPARQRVTLDLLAGGPQPPDTAVLLAPSTQQRYSLVEPDGDAFGLSLALAVPSNSTIHVDGFLNGPDSRRGANFEVEVVSLTVTALPAHSPTDQNANLLPDAYELLVFGTAGAAPERDTDSDGASDLQEYLENTDPTDTTSTPSFSTPALGVPDVVITVEGTALAVSWDVPARYQSRFEFTLETTDDLKNTPFAAHASAVAIGTGDTMRCDLLRDPEGTKRFYRVRTALR